MSVSIDTRKIEKLTQLETALELLQNPELYTSMLAEVKSVLKQYNNLSQKYVTIEAAEKFLQEAKAVLDKAKQEAYKERQNLELDIKKEKAKQEEELKVLYLKKQDLSSKEKALSEKEKEVLEKQTRFEHQALVVDKTQRYEKQALDNLHQELVKRELVLKEKEVGLKKLFGV